MNSIVVKDDVMYFYSQPQPVPKYQSQFSEIEFRFSPAWEGRTKTAQFKQENKVENVLIKDDKCFFPTGFDIGQATISLRGDKDNYSIATVNRLSLEVVESFEPGGNIPPNPDLYTQLVHEFKTIAQETENIANSVRKDADEGKFVGETGPQGPVGPVGPQGPKGGVLFPKLVINPQGHLMLSETEGTNLDFRLKGKNLEVIIND